MKYGVVIVAAGKGSRMHLGFNKVFADLKDGCSILEHSVQIFLSDPDCAQIVVVTDPGQYCKQLKLPECGRITLACGGSTRQESVCNGLEAMLCDIVMIHDGARPFLSASSLSALKQAMETEQAACLMVPCKDTIKVVKDGYIEETLPRESLMAAQTPQVFHTKDILACMHQAIADGYTGTDDCSLLERYSSIPIRAVTGDYTNLKITTPEDLK